MATVPLPAEIIDAYRRALEIRGDVGCCVVCHEERYDCDAYRSAELALDRLLNLAPWEVSPLDVDDGPSPWPSGSAGARSWPKAQKLQRRLEKAISD